ncbi:DUF4365 domain-containing protein [Flavobacterium sp. 14A]|uniref:DUF4365 domain-containing protein n=1 Tax=Flavobacterium sp. 14A TaxID=2735896 RepID=UPI00156D8D2B|nr:DUF4365 domain-containing protein [Flavobacterium sp. 14A]NRT13594.1 hypothetical protein [Flavobacterium sp. 14A]
MNTPIVTGNYYKEREGVLKVALELNSHGYVFRETPNGDIGIDGQIEHNNEKGEATGKIVAAQIKSGNSYLVDKGDHFAFYPKEKHKNYWSIFPLPVILFVYYPSDGEIYFTDVRYQLNIPNKKHTYIVIDKKSTLNSVSAKDIFETTGTLDIPYYSIDQVFSIMINTVCQNPTFHISYLDLFTQGLTNLCRHVYFSMDLALTIAKFNNETEFGLSIGFTEHEFLHHYIKFLMSQNLATINYSDYLIDWKERELEPTFISPLTIRGRELLEFIKKTEDSFKTELPPTTLVRERYIAMRFISQDDIMRLNLGKKLREIIKKPND